MPGSSEIRDIIAGPWWAEEGNSCPVERERREWPQVGGEGAWGRGHSVASTELHMSAKGCSHDSLAQAGLGLLLPLGQLAEAVLRALLVPPS